MELKETNHSYYCECYEGDCSEEYENWQSFKNDGGLDVDLDYNLLFRFDIVEEENNEYILQLHYAKQRHGQELWHDIIHNIQKEDMPEIEKYLKKVKKHLISHWKEIDIEQNKTKNRLAR